MRFRRSTSASTPSRRRRPASQTQWPITSPSQSADASASTSLSRSAQPQTTVEVTDVALQLETETSERGQTITNYQSEALPLVSRNYSDLLGLMPGSRQAPTAATTSSINSLVRAGSYNVNGQRSMFNNFLLDGMDNNAYGESNQGFDNQIIAVPPDSVAQFQVVTNNESAEYGRSSGATVNVASQSGTNRFHATVYEFIRNTDLNAAGFFKPLTVSNTGTTVPFQKPTFNRNQFGVNFGGPIVKDKLFFFLDYEGFRQVLKPLSVLTLPTQNELNGILVVPVKNPTDRASSIPAGTADPSQRNQSALGADHQLLQTDLAVSPVSGAARPRVSRPTTTPFRFPSPTTPTRATFASTGRSIPTTRPSCASATARRTASTTPAFRFRSTARPTATSASSTSRSPSATPTSSAPTRSSMPASASIAPRPASSTSPSATPPSTTSPACPTSNAVVAGGLPSIGITGFTGFGRQSTNPQWQDPALIDPKVNFTWVKGKHSLKFGYEYEHVWMAVNDNNPLYGSFTYGGGYSNAGGSTVSDTYWADFLFGTTNAYSLANYYVAHLRRTCTTSMRRTTGRSVPNLTLNLGLRWEYGSPYSDLYNHISNFDPGIADRAHHHARSCRRQRHHSRLRRRDLRQDPGQS